MCWVRGSTTNVALCHTSDEVPGNDKVNLQLLCLVTSVNWESEPWKKQAKSVVDQAPVCPRLLKVVSEVDGLNHIE